MFLRVCLRQRLRLFSSYACQRLPIFPFRKKENKENDETARNDSGMLPQSTAKCLGSDWAYVRQRLPVFPFRKKENKEKDETARNVRKKEN